MVSAQRVDSLFGCLSHPHRRSIVQLVSNEDEPLTINELAREITAHTDTDYPSDAETNPVELVEVDLYHTHLPKLSEAEIIEYDPQNRLVVSTESTTHLNALIEIAISIVEVM